ncbi:MAG TPA: hypothetical protein VMT20_14035 [Terriglobia bacterium]|nr:hypothetical protein [Terriglobia bacterium]
MAEVALRLGDLIDDYCPRCKLLLNHAIASMMDGRAVKVICKTCYTEHAFRHGEGGKKKAPAGMTLFEQVLSNAASAPPEEPAEPATTKKKKAAAPARYISRHKERPRKKS